MKTKNNTKYYLNDKKWLFTADQNLYTNKQNNKHHEQISLESEHDNACANIFFLQQKQILMNHEHIILLSEEYNLQRKII